MQKYKATGYLTLFDEEERQQRLSKIGMVDASFVLAPRQHNTPEENKQIKDEEGDGLWKDNPHKKCQKDTDALWTQKGGVDYFGYKNHIKSVGLARAASTTGMFNLVYNMCRYEQIVRLGLLRPEK